MGPWKRQRAVSLVSLEASERRGVRRVPVAAVVMLPLRLMFLLTSVVVVVMKAPQPGQFLYLAVARANRLVVPSSGVLHALSPPPIALTATSLPSTTLARTHTTARVTIPNSQTRSPAVLFLLKTAHVFIHFSANLQRETTKMTSGAKPAGAAFFQHVLRSPRHIVAPMVDQVGTWWGQEQGSEESEGTRERRKGYESHHTCFRSKEEGARRRKAWAEMCACVCPTVLLASKHVLVGLCPLPSFIVWTRFADLAAGRAS